MRGLLIAGAVSLASALAVSCGDDSGDGPGGGGSGGTGGNGGSAGGGGNGGSAMAGNGGSAGTSGGSAGASGGSAGSAGSSAGAAGNGSEDPDAGTGDASTGDASTGDASTGDASTGDAGDLGDAGDGGGPPPCTGCVELRVPFTASNEAAFFQIAADSADVSDTVVTFRVSAKTLDETGQTYLHPFATDNSAFTQVSAANTLINAATFTDTNTFVDLSFDLGGVIDADFDKADVIAVGLQVGSGGALQGPLTTVLVVDSITFTGSSGLEDRTFTTDAGGFAPNTFAGLQTTTLLHHPE